MMHGHNKMVGLFVLLIAVTFLLRAFGALDQVLVDVIWPVFLGIIALFWMGHR